MKTIEQQIGEALAKESGMGGVCIWRMKDDPLKETDEWKDDRLYVGTVGEFLSKKENQIGLWLVDGGWGGPPGPIHVRWNDNVGEWENGGFCGRLFK